MEGSGTSNNASAVSGTADNFFLTMHVPCVMFVAANDHFSLLAPKLHEFRTGSKLLRFYRR